MVQLISPFAVDAENQDTYPSSETPWGKMEFSSTEEFEKKIVSKFESELQAFKNFRANYYDPLWRSCDDAYFGVKKTLNVNDAEKEYRSNIRVRYCYKQVESQTSKIVPSILSAEPPCSVIPNDENSERQEAKAKGIQKILRHYMLQKQNGLQLIYNWIKQGNDMACRP